MRVWTPSETVGAHNSRTTTYAAAGTGWVRLDVPRRTLQSFGAGDVPAGSMEVEGHAALPLEAGRVVEVLAGPEAGTKWRAESAHRPGNGSVFALVEPFNAPLPAVTP